MLVWKELLLLRIRNLRFDNLSRSHLQSQVSFTPSVDCINVWLLLSLAKFQCCYWLLKLWLLFIVVRWMNAFSFVHSYETLQTSMAITKELQFMLNSVLNRTLPFFFDHALWMNSLTGIFVLVSCSNTKPSTSNVIAHGQGRKTITETSNKDSDISQFS